ncbi:MAG: anhydro-N-acetylmuramic acid kinase, partial [Crocinitomicaceae bacterium]|nr:anhydro-N-acetylmuramic acid kinase [Crocinitomicaceae bacterium]
MSTTKSFRVIGLMSGTSLDGLDLADVTFIQNGDNYNFHLNHAITYSFEDDFSKRLKNAVSNSGFDLMLLSRDFEILQADAVENYIKEYAIQKDEIDFVATHGHTVFHQPANNWTLQIGNGPRMAAMTGMPWVCDFRTMDVALGGQGAPLVPIGDLFLFGNQADAFLNLGGFANLSYKKSNSIYAHDLCPVNVVLNQLANHYGLPYDQDGKL